MYRGVRGLPVGFSAATTTGSPILNLLLAVSIALLNRAGLAAFPAWLRFSLLLST
jgi:hypothetical protein